MDSSWRHCLFFLYVLGASPLNIVCPSFLCQLLSLPLYIIFRIDLIIPTKLITEIDSISLNCGKITTVIKITFATKFLAKSHLLQRSIHCIYQIAQGFFRVCVILRNILQRSKHSPSGLETSKRWIIF